MSLRRRFRRHLLSGAGDGAGDIGDSKEHQTMKPRELDERQQTEIEAAVFRRLLEHLDEHKEVQNVDLMNLAGFCRNCLAKWYRAAAEAAGVPLDYEDVRERVYGMPYGEWKERHQLESRSSQA
jgi:uncharacterized protein